MKKAPALFLKYGDYEAEKGMAHISLANSSSKTVIERLRTRTPLLVQRALYPDTGLPQMAHVYLMSSSGGILQGDRFDIRVDAGENTMSRIMTQAATKIYRMDKGFALQRISISAQEGSYVEFVPHQLIPFKSSRFYQQVNMQVAKNSTIVYSETVSAGRTASGEKFAFDVCFLSMAATDPHGAALFSDVCNMEPDGRKQFGLLFGNKTIWSTTYVLAQQPEVIEREVAAAIGARHVLAGCSQLPRDSGLVVRILDDSIDRVASLTNTIVRIARRHATERGSC